MEVYILLGYHTESDEYSVYEGAFSSKESALKYLRRIFNCCTIQTLTLPSFYREESSARIPERTFIWYSLDGIEIPSVEEAKYAVDSYDFEGESPSWMLIKEEVL